MADFSGETGDVRKAADAGYGEELLCANWNPVIALLDWSCARTAQRAARREPNKLREEDAEAFLGRIYSAGT